MDKPGHVWRGMALEFRHNRPAVPHGMPRQQFAETAQAALALPVSMRCSSPYSCRWGTAESCCGYAGTRFLPNFLGCIQAELNQFSDQVPGPLVNVVFLDVLAHAMHAKLLLLRLHLQSGADGFGGLIDVIGIDQQCVPQSGGRSCELAEDENAPFIPSRGQKFLGYEIHSIVQRRHQAEIGCAVIGLNLLMAVLALEKHNGVPLSSLETPIDAFRLGFHFGEQVVIALDMCPARSSDLHECEFPLIAGEFLEESLDRKEPLKNSLGIVDAIDTNSHERRLHAQAPQ